MTRDYQADPPTGRPVTGRSRHSTSPTVPARRRRNRGGPAGSAAWLRTMFAIVPLAVGVRVDDAHELGHEFSQWQTNSPIPIRYRTNFGWSAREACYACAVSYSKTTRRW